VTSRQDWNQASNAEGPPHARAAREPDRLDARTRVRAISLLGLVALAFALAPWISRSAGPVA
jgi:ferric-dicitrate binding protein FerR (iron transport regulator)